MSPENDVLQFSILFFVRGRIKAPLAVSAVAVLLAQFLQLVHAVAVLRRGEEIERFGGSFHILLRLCDQRVEVFACHVGSLYIGGLHVAILRRQVEGRRRLLDLFALGGQQRALSRAAALRLPRQHLVFEVVAYLLFAAAVALDDGVAHRVGAVVGVEDHIAVGVACGASRDLGDRPHVAQEPLLVGVENGDEPHLRQVQPFAQW